MLQIRELGIHATISILCSDRNQEGGLTAYVAHPAAQHKRLLLRYPSMTEVTIAKIPRCGIRKSPSIACFGSEAGVPTSTPRIVARLSAIDQINRGAAVNT
jgi:hypothetical protein